MTALLVYVFLLYVRLSFRLRNRLQLLYSLLICIRNLSVLSLFKRYYLPVSPYLKDIFTSYFLFIVSKWLLQFHCWYENKHVNEKNNVIMVDDEWVISISFVLALFVIFYISFVGRPLLPAIYQLRRIRPFFVVEYPVKDVDGKAKANAFIKACREDRPHAQ